MGSRLGDVKMTGKIAVAGLASVLALAPFAAQAASEPPVELSQCDASLGSIAVVEGDTQGWSEYGLGSPRELIAALASESGCFSLHNVSSTVPAKFLLNVIAGDQEEVDQGMEIAKGAAVEGLVRSGAAGQVLSKVPVGGALMGMFGGLGGKKKTVAAGIRVISPANGMTIASGSGVVKKSTISFANGSGGWVGGAAAAGYASNGKGKMLTEAFIKAFNAVVAQGDTLASAAAPAALAPATPLATVAVDSNMYALPAAGAAVSRAVRAGTTLTPTGARDGMFVEVADSFGTKGWMSVEDLN